MDRQIRGLGVPEEESELEENDDSDAKPSLIVDGSLMTLDAYGVVNLKLLSELKFALSLFKKKIGNAKSKNKWVTLTISSCGGTAFVGLAAHDLIRSSGLLVETVALGEVSSAAVLIFLAGRKRKMHENSFLCVHEIGSYPESDSKEEVDIYLRWAAQYNKLYTQIALQNSKMTRSKYLALSKKERYIMAEEAVRLGLAHEIIRNQ